MKQEHINTIKCSLVSDMLTLNRDKQYNALKDVQQAYEAFNEEIEKPKHKCPYEKEWCIGEDITCYKCLNGGKDGEI